MSDPVIRHRQSNFGTGTVTPTVAPVDGNFGVLVVRVQNDVNTDVWGAPVAITPPATGTTYFVKIYTRIFGAGETTWEIPNFAAGTRGWSYYELSSTNAGSWELFTKSDAYATATAGTVHNAGSLNHPAESVVIAGLLATSSQSTAGGFTWTAPLGRDYFHLFSGTAGSAVRSAAGSVPITCTLGEAKGAAMAAVVIHRPVPPPPPPPAASAVVRGLATFAPLDGIYRALSWYGRFADAVVAPPPPVVASSTTWMYTTSTRAEVQPLLDGYTATGEALFVTPRPVATWPGQLIAYRTWDPGIDARVVPTWADQVPAGYVRGPATGQWYHPNFAPDGVSTTGVFRAPNGFPDFFGGNETAAFGFQTSAMPNGTWTQTMFQELDFLVEGQVVTERLSVRNFTVANVTAPPPAPGGVITLNLASHGEAATGVVVKAGSSAPDRGTVMAATVGGRTGTFWRARHPGPSSSLRWGTDWRCAFNQMTVPIPPADEMWFAYDVFHKTDWNTAQNGPGDRKMPCLAGYDTTVNRIGDVDNSGSSTEAHRDDQWTARWMAQGRNTADIFGIGYLNVWALAGVLHNDNRANTNSGIMSFSNGLQWRLDASGANPRTNIPKGWSTIEQHVVMNTPGQSNGTVEWWVNGVLVARRTDVGYRNAQHPNLRINALNLCMFWGGPVPAENPTEATEAWFDNFRFSTVGRIT